MTKQQADWAHRHEWFIKAREVGPNEYVVDVRDEVVHRDGRLTSQVRSFKTHSRLRDWAGY